MRDVGDDFGQARAFGFVFDAARERDARLVGHQHDEAARERDVGGEARALFADRILDHLHDDGFAFAHAFGDAGLIHEARQIGEAARFARGEEARLLQTQIDEGRLHAGQHALNAAEHDVAEQAMTAAAGARAVARLDRAFEEDLAQTRLFDERDARFGGRRR